MASVGDPAPPGAWPVVLGLHARGGRRTVERGRLTTSRSAAHRSMTTLPEAGPLDAEAAPLGRAAGLVASMRPQQWIKNLACFAGLIFSGHLFDISALGRAAWAFLGFCLASSSIYLVNDVCDRRGDAANPKKRSRPIASGRLPVAWALAASAVLAAAALGSALLLTAGCLAVLATYLVMGVAYSVRL